MPKPITVPRVQFKFAPARQEADLFAHFCKRRANGWDWSETIYKRHPELREIFKDSSQKDYAKAAYPYTVRYIREHKKRLTTLVARYQKEWDNINDRYLTILSTHLETSYPKSPKVMIAYVSIVPIYPRDIDTWKFNVTSLRPERMKSIAMHEILHFLYFKKWMEVFPKTKRKELDSPHLVWMLSEILDPIILNHNADIQKLNSASHGHYTEFRTIKIGRKSMIKHFEALYTRHLKTKEPFATFLETCWAEAKKHRKIIENI